MSRTFWFAAGAASAVYTTYKVRRAAQAFTPDGIGARVAALGVGARLFAGEVAAGMAEREAELRTELRLPTRSRPAIAPGLSPVPEREGGGDGHR